MESDLIAILQTLLDLGFPAVVLVAAWFLWAAYKARTDQVIETLREHAANCQREKELYAGILLDRAKASIYEPDRLRYPASPGVRTMDDTSPPPPPK